MKTRSPLFKWLIVVSSLCIAVIVYFVLGNKSSPTPFAALDKPAEKSGKKAEPRNSLLHPPRAADRNEQDKVLTNPVVTIQDPEVAKAVEMLIAEDVSKMQAVVQLDESQLSKIEKALRKARSEPIVVGGEMNALAAILRPDQLNKWTSFLEHELREGAENYANTNIATIGRVVFNLTQNQKAELFQSLSGTVIGSEQRTETEIIQSVLDEGQLGRWKAYQFQQQ